MNVVAYAEENRAAWNAFAQESDDAWFWHLREWTDYTKVYRPELKARDLSFLIQEGGQVQAIVPLLLEEFTAEGRIWKEFSFAGGPGPSVAFSNALNENQRLQLLRFILEFIDGLAAETGAARASFYTPPLRPGRQRGQLPFFNDFLKYGYSDITLGTQFIPLTISEHDLREGLRRNHLRNIEKGQSQLNITIFDKGSITAEIFDRYREMHGRAAGRVTRPLQTFELMRQWIVAGHAFLTEARLKSGAPVGYELYFVYKNGVYGASACNEPGYEKMPIRHLIEWESILWMRAHGVTYYDIGTQHFGTLPYDFPDDKNRDISDFKLGFGGTTVPAVMSEKFYTKEHWLTIQRQRQESFERAPEWAQASARRAEAQVFLKRQEKQTAGPTPVPDGPLPEEAIRKAKEVLSLNQTAAAQAKAGNDRVLQFLVGQALRDKSMSVSPIVLRRAIQKELEV